MKQDLLTNQNGALSSAVVKDFDNWWNWALVLSFSPGCDVVEFNEPSIQLQSDATLRYLVMIVEGENV